MSDQSTTPRTDAARIDCGWDTTRPVVPFVFARQLEKELAKANAHRKEPLRLMERSNHELATLRAKLAECERERDAAVSNYETAVLAQHRAEAERDALAADVLALRGAASAIREYVTEQVGPIADIPDEIWLPFIAAIAAAPKRESKSKGIAMTVEEIRDPALRGRCNHCGADLDFDDASGNWISQKADPYAAHKAAFAAGKVIQGNETPQNDNTWFDIIGEPMWQMWPPDRFRIKPDPAPLTAADFPPGTVVRHRSWPADVWDYARPYLSTVFVLGQRHHIDYPDFTTSGWQRRIPGGEWV